jgi:glutaredoxin 3
MSCVANERKNKKGNCDKIEKNVRGKANIVEIKHFRKGDSMAKIVIYTTPNCPFCMRARKYLEEKGLPFEYIDVSIDREGLKELRRKSGQMGVPVFEIDGKMIIGFSREKIEKALSGSEEETKTEKAEEVPDARF